MWPSSSQCLSAGPCAQFVPPVRAAATRRTLSGAQATSSSRCVPYHSFVRPCWQTVPRRTLHHSAQRKDVNYEAFAPHTFSVCVVAVVQFGPVPGSVTTCWALHASRQKCTIGHLFKTTHCNYLSSHGASLSKKAPPCPAGSEVAVRVHRVRHADRVRAACAGTIAHRERRQGLTAPPARRCGRL